MDNDALKAKIEAAYARMHELIDSGMTEHEARVQMIAEGKARQHTARVARLREEREGSG